MYACLICNKKFKSAKALGGHTSNAHPRNRSEITVNPPETTAVVHEPEEADFEEGQPVNEDFGIMDTIREYKGRGFSARQIKDLGYARQTVDDVFLEDIQPDRQPQDTAGNSSHEGDDWLPASYKKDQVANPAVLLYKAIDGSEESEIEFRGMLKLRAAMLMVMDLVNIQKGQAEADAKRLDPLLKVLREGREELDAAAARAKNSSYEIALRAADEVAQGMKGAFSAEMRELKSAIPGPPDEMNPMAKMFFSAMQPYAGQAIAQMFSGIFKMPVQAGAQPQQPVDTPRQPAQPAIPDNAPPSCMRQGEEKQFTEE